MIHRLQEELLKELPGMDAQFLMAPPIRLRDEIIPPDHKKSAVAVCVFPVEGDYAILLMKRTEDGRVHSGQISFPGGRHEAPDYTLLYTAQRELYEEVGLSNVTVLGSLTPTYITPSRFMVNPYLMYVDNLDELNISDKEVSQVIHLPFQSLLDPSNKRISKVRRSDDPNIEMETPTYTVGDSIIWGATAMILSELEVLIRRCQ